MVPSTFGLDQTFFNFIHIVFFCFNFINYVTAYPVAPHAPTGFVPAPGQAATYGGKNIYKCFILFIIKIKYFILIVPGASPYGVFPNQPQLYAAQGPPPPTYDQTLTHPMVIIIIF